MASAWGKTRQSLGEGAIFERMRRACRLRQGPRSYLLRDRLEGEAAKVQQDQGTILAITFYNESNHIIATRITAAGTAELAQVVKFLA